MNSKPHRFQSLYCTLFHSPNNAHAHIRGVLKLDHSYTTGMDDANPCYHFPDELMFLDVSPRDINTTTWCFGDLNASEIQG